jgi:hypothetical protein
MADTKISALTGATTPLAGTEVLPIVQSGVTVKVAVSNLTAGRAVGTAALSATGIILTTDATDASSTTAASLKTAGGLAVVKKTYVGDNIVQATAAKGFDFAANTPAAGKTSTILNWYEEGTFTPSVADAATGGNVGTIGGSGYYTRIGRQVTVHFITNTNINTTGMTAGNAVYFLGMPFVPLVSASSGAFYSYRVGGGAGQSASIQLTTVSATTVARLFIYTGVSATTDTLLKVSDLVSGTSKISFNVTYFI